MEVAFPVEVEAVQDTCDHFCFIDVPRVKQDCLVLTKGRGVVDQGHCTLEKAGADMLL